MNNENNLNSEIPVKEKPQNKKTVLKLFAFLATLVIVVVAIVIKVRTGSPERRLQAQLDLGNKYLSELEYEQAIACFEAAIAIEPKCVEAYSGLADAYDAMGDYDSALAALKRGYDATGDDSLLERIKEYENKGIAEQSENNSQVISDLSDGEEWKNEFSDLKAMLDEYIEIYYAHKWYGSGDFEACFITVDEVQESIDPLIKRMEDFVEYKKTHDVDPQEEMDYFEWYISSYTLRDLYIRVHRFDKSAETGSFGGESLDGMYSEYDEYNRETYFRQNTGDYSSYVWGDDGCVASYKWTYVSGEAYPVGTTEEHTLKYDNGRIAFEHLTQINGETGYRFECDVNFTYEGNTVTVTYSDKGGVFRTVVIEINKYGSGTVISETPN